MYPLVFLLFMTAAWCQSTTPLIPVKKGYFDISPATTQVTLTSQSGSLSDTIDLNDPGNLFGDSSDYSDDAVSGSPQKLIDFFSSPSDSFQFHPVYNMVSDIASNVCLMSLSSKEEDVSDAVDPDAVIKKMGTLTSVIMADLASVADKPQTLLHLYSAIKSENSLFNTAELSSPGGILQTNGLNSRVKVQVTLGGFPSFDLGVHLRTGSRSKETQCVSISKLAAIHALNKITKSSIHALEQSTKSDVDGANIQLDSSNIFSSSPQTIVPSSISMFAKEVANVASSLGSSDIVTEAISISNNADQIRSSFSSLSSIPVIEKDLSSFTETNIPGNGGGVNGGNINMLSSSYNTMEPNTGNPSIQPTIQEDSVNQVTSYSTNTMGSNTEYNGIQPMIQNESVNEVPSIPSPSPLPSPNYETVTSIQSNTEQPTTTTTTTMISNNGNNDTTNTISTTSGTSVNSNTNTNTNTNTENSPTQPILSSIPNRVGDTMASSINYNRETGVPVGGGVEVGGPSAFLSRSNPNSIMQTKPKMNMLLPSTQRPDLNTQMMMMRAMMMNRPVLGNRMAVPNMQGRAGYNAMDRNVFY